MARRLIAGIALASAAGLAAAGCSGSDDSDNKAAPEVVWAGKICDAIADGGGKVSLPNVDNARDAKALKAGYLSFLNGMTHKLGTVETTLRKAGAPPVADGRTAWSKALANLQAARSALNGATADVRRAKTTDVRTFEKSLKRTQTALAKYSTYQGPVGDLRANPALSVAFAKAPSCVSNKL